MIMDGLTEEQAQAEIDRIDEERESAMFADPSIFNDEVDTNNSTDNDTDTKVDNKFDNAKDDE